MFTGEGSFERGRREALEGREAIARQARIEAETAGAARNRLEKGSPSWARRNFAGILNAMVADAAAREMPGLAALEGIRKGQRHGYRTADQHNRTYEKLEKSGAFEALDRLHPASAAAERRGRVACFERRPGAGSLAHRRNWGD
jgi:hypothetical protein